MASWGKYFIYSSAVISTLAANVVHATPQNKNVDVSDYSRKKVLGRSSKNNSKNDLENNKNLNNKSFFGYIKSTSVSIKEAVSKYWAVIVGALTLGEIAHAAYKINSVKDSKGKSVLIMGKACSGKGANFRTIADMYNLEPYGPGNDCRDEIKKPIGESLLTEEDRALLAQGLMISNDTVGKITKRAVSKAKK